MMMVAIIAIVVASAKAAAAATVVYAPSQNTTSIQQINYSNTNTTIPQIKGLNSSIIINAINSKIRSVYEGEGEMPIISKVRH
jgi:hypothetical protein